MLLYYNEGDREEVMWIERLRGFLGDSVIYGELELLM